MRRNNLRILAILIVGCLTASLLLSCSLKKEESIINAPIVAGLEPVSLKISCVGDVMVHKTQIPSQYDSATGAYDYNNNFQYVKKYIENSDLSLFNLETTFGDKPYTGYPTFSAPDELASALKNAGFTVAITANNHMLDRGIVGLKRTLDVLLASGFVTAGSRMEQEQARFAIADVKGIKVGVVAYTYAVSGAQGNLLVNGSAVSEESASLINYFRYAQIDEDLARVKATVDEARNAGAQVVIVYYHWGEEYQLRANHWQRYMAQQTVDNMDVDMIFASHPHTLQEMAPFTKAGTDKQVPVFFSMGNFISNQRLETLDNPYSRYTEIGVIAQVDLEYDLEEEKITAIQMSAIPTWVEKYKSGGKDVYAVIPLDENLDTNEALSVSGHLSRAKKALEDARGILESN